MEMWSKVKEELREVQQWQSIDRLHNAWDCIGIVRWRVVKISPVPEGKRIV